VREIGFQYRVALLSGFWASFATIAANNYLCIVIKESYKSPIKHFLNIKRMHFLSNIYPIPIEEVLKILNNINVAKCLGIGSLSYKILPKILL